MCFVVLVSVVVPYVPDSRSLHTLSERSCRVVWISRRMPPKPPTARTRPKDAAPRANRRRAPADRRQTLERREPLNGIPEALAQRVIIERIRPAVDNGRWPIKRTVGEPIQVFADIFADGHDVVAAVLRDCCAALTDETPPRPGAWRERPMTLIAPGTDEWTATVEGATEPGWHEYQVVAWVDAFRTWRREVQVKVSAGQEVAVELIEGAQLIRAAAARAARLAADEEAGGRPNADEEWLNRRADAMADRASAAGRVQLGLAEDLLARMDRYADRSRATISPTYRAWVDRERARFGAWY